MQADTNPMELILSESPEIKNEIAAIHNAYENAASKYPRKLYSMRRHLKATHFLVFIFLLQETFFLIYIRINRKYYYVLRVINSFGWIVIGVLLVKKLL